MNARFYLKQAYANLTKNGRLYIPYTIAVAGMVAMLYIVQFLYGNEGLGDNAGVVYLRELMFFGCVVTAIFVMVFLFYTNSFVIKRRSREFGLYGILGLEKKHVGTIMFVETAMLYAVCLVSGLVVGILFSKAMFLLLLRILGLDVKFGFEIPPGAIAMTAILIGVIFLATHILNLFRVRMAKPVELLNAGKAGEREPKARWPVAILGLVCLGSGFAIAQTQANPLAALVMIFIAIVLMIAGTYLTFTAGSIALLKLMRRNKGYYYKTRNFISVSGMIYRMKQNAAGLASICVLSTAVLVILSTTVSLYTGIEDVLRTRFPRNITVEARGVTNEEAAKLDFLVERIVTGGGINAEDVVRERYMFFLVTRDESGAFRGSRQNSGQSASVVGTDFASLLCVPVSEYNRLYGASETLDANEALIYGGRDIYAGETVKIGELEYSIKSSLDSLDIVQNAATRSVENYWIIVPDGAIDRIAAALGEEATGAGLFYSYSFDSSASAEDQIALSETLREELGQEEYVVYVDSAESWRVDLRATYGGLLFLGIFLGGLFLAATILIIYYKQVSEGYQDRERFAVMQQVGLTKAEVRSAIRSQVLSVFFLPLVMSAIHIVALFKIVTQLLEVLNLTNVGLFALCTVVIILAFAALYAAIYAVTARVYYRVVGG